MLAQKHTNQTGSMTEPDEVDVGRLRFSFEQRARPEQVLVHVGAVLSSTGAYSAFRVR